MYFWCVCYTGELGFINCNDVCMCVVRKQFQLLEFVFDSVYVDVLGLCACMVYVVVWSSLVCP